MATEPVNQCNPPSNVGELAHYLRETVMAPALVVELATWIEEARKRMPERPERMGWQENRDLKETIAAQSKRIRELVDEEQRAWKECGTVERKLVAVTEELMTAKKNLEEATKKLNDIPTLIFTDMADKGEDYFRRLRASITELLKNHR